MSSLLEMLKDPEVWDAYFAEKQEKGHLTRKEEAELKRFIEERAYLPAAERFLSGEGLSLPEIRRIRKTGSAKKREVYLYPEDENRVLKVLTWLLLRKYDHVFPGNLYSFRLKYGVGKALYRLLNTRGICRMYSYKADISDYFNSIPVEKLFPEMEEVLSDEPECLALLKKALTEPRIIDDGRITEKKKGVMAGTPFAVFLANLYLTGLDRQMEARGILYARYSDDIIFFTETSEERDREAAFAERFIEERGLKLNPEKIVLTSPGEPWSFLGIKYHNGTVDISDISKTKLKARIRRRARALQRWKVRKKASGTQAVKGFIRAMNKKFFEADSSHELTWCRWYFPLITTDASLREIDEYMQYWIRALYSGRHREKNYGMRYEEMKSLGYVSLVHAYYIDREEREKKKLQKTAGERPDLQK